LTLQVCCVATFLRPLVQQQAVRPNLQQLLTQLLTGCSPSNVKWHQSHAMLHTDCSCLGSTSRDSAVWWLMLKQQQQQQQPKPSVAALARSGLAG
jgi:hypothetical protein